MAERTRLSDVFVEMCVQYELQPGRDPETLRHTLAAVARELLEARAAIRDIVTILATDEGGGVYQPNGISRQWVADKLRALLPEGA